MANFVSVPDSLPSSSSLASSSADRTSQWSNAVLTENESTSKSDLASNQLASTNQLINLKRLSTISVSNKHRRRTIAFGEGSSHDEEISVSSVIVSCSKGSRVSSKKNKRRSLSDNEDQKDDDESVAEVDEDDEILVTSPSYVASGPLSTVVIYIEVFSGRENRSHYFAEELKDLGATVCPRLLLNKVTHVLFREGRYTTVLRAWAKKIPVVSVMWLDRCMASHEKVDETPYLITKENYDGIERLKIGKCMQPSVVDPEVALSDQRLRRRAKRNETRRLMKEITNMSIPKTPDSYLIPDENDEILVHETPLYDGQYESYASRLLKSNNRFLTIPETCTPDSLRKQMNEIRAKLSSLMGSPNSSSTSDQPDCFMQIVRRKLSELQNSRPAVQFHAATPCSPIPDDPPATGSYADDLNSLSLKYLISRSSTPEQEKQMQCTPLENFSHSIHNTPATPRRHAKPLFVPVERRSLFDFGFKKCSQNGAGLNNKFTHNKLELINYVKQTSKPNNKEGNKLSLRKSCNKTFETKNDRSKCNILNEDSSNSIRNPANKENQLVNDRYEKRLERTLTKRNIWQSFVDSIKSKNLLNDNDYRSFDVAVGEYLNLTPEISTQSTEDSLHLILSKGSSMSTRNSSKLTNTNLSKSNNSSNFTDVSVGSVFVKTTTSNLNEANRRKTVDMSTNTKNSSNHFISEESSLNVIKDKRRCTLSTNNTSTINLAEDNESQLNHSKKKDAFVTTRRRHHQKLDRKSSKTCQTSTACSDIIFENETSVNVSSIDNSHADNNQLNSICSIDESDSIKSILHTDHNNQRALRRASVSRRKTVCINLNSAENLQESVAGQAIDGVSKRVVRSRRRLGSCQNKNVTDKLPSSEMSQTIDDVRRKVMDQKFCSKSQKSNQRRSCVVKMPSTVCKNRQKSSKILGPKSPVESSQSPLSRNESPSSSLFDFLLDVTPLKSIPENRRRLNSSAFLLKTRSSSSKRLQLGRPSEQEFQKEPLSKFKTKPVVTKKSKKFGKKM